MPIKTNLKSLTPRKEQYKREITLLSGGHTNPRAWPGGKIIVYPWDNDIDDWVIENVRKLSKEEFIFHLLERCCKMEGAKADDFVADEINLILLVSRARLSADKIAYKSVCPFCAHKKDEEVMIPDELGKEGEKKPDWPGYDVITLPELQDKVKIRPLLVKDERMIVGRPAHERMAVSDSTLRTLMRVVDINDTQPDSLDELVKWFRAIPPTDAKFLDSEGRRLTPHLDTAIPHKCDECSREFNHLIEFGTDFFR